MDPFDIDNYKKREKEKKKEHMLVSNKPELIMRLIGEVTRY